ncbi:MAG: thiamine/thiamine pyrophosphate ABC transporter permease ThiP, partial [Rhodobacteraceae bacterium]|nr:thiamine/thiamine pyrophosphate ABC transporter permease ThiP [Paracoccaceae bacterium]
MRQSRAITLALASVVALWLIALNFGALGAVAWHAEGLTGLRAADWSAVRFTLLQAFLSALLSV